MFSFSYMEPVCSFHHSKNKSHWQSVLIPLSSSPTPTSHLSPQETLICFQFMDGPLVSGSFMYYCIFKVHLCCSIINTSFLWCCSLQPCWTCLLAQFVFNHTLGNLGYFYTYHMLIQFYSLVSNWTTYLFFLPKCLY